MIDRVLSSRVCDLAYYYGWGSNAFGALAGCLLPTSGSSVASQSQTYKSSVEKSIKNLLRTLDRYEN